MSEIEQRKRNREQDTERAVGVREKTAIPAATILVVDDHAPSRQFLTTLLTYKGHRILEASDGMEALAIARAEQPDLILSDVLMPTMDGYEFVRHLRNDPLISRTKVIFCTAVYHVEQTRALAAACGVLHTISKPAEPETVLHTVNAALSEAPPPGPIAVPEEFDGEHLKLLTNKLFKKISELERATLQNSEILDIARQLASEENSEHLLQNLCLTARRLTGARFAGVGVVKPGEPLLQSFSVAGVDAQTMVRLKPPVVSLGLLQRICHGLRPLRIGDSGSDPITAVFPASYGSTRPFLGTPLSSGSELYGVLYLVDKLGADGFSEQDEKIVVSLAAQATVSYENQQRLHKMKQYAEELRSTEEQLRQLAENIPEIFFVMTLAPPRITYISPAFDEIWGRSRQALYEDPRAWIEAIHADDQERVGITFAESLRGNGLDMEYRVVRPDGSLRHIHARAFPVPNPEGKPSRMVGLAEDVTSRKRVEEHDRLQSAALEAAANAILITDAGGIIQWVNPAFTRLTGFPLEEAVGQNPRILKSGKQDQSFYQNLWNTIVAGKVWAGEITNLKKDGQPYTEEMTIAPLRSQNGEITNFVAIKQDVTERKRMEAELVRAKDLAEVANRAKSEFLANMSHEIRTPMNGIIGMTDLALETELNPEQAEYLHMVKGSADALLTLLNDILDFSKIEAGKLELNYLSFDLRKSLSEVVRTLAVNAQRKGLEFIFDVSPEVPTNVIGDPARLRQVLVNLVGNAIKFTESGEIEVNVRTETRSVGETVLHFSVRDTGIGIPVDKQHKIFDAFSQADSSSTRKYGGTGLGLTISAQLVGLMRGEIWVESEPAKGSTFHFTVQVSPGVAALSSEPLDVSQLGGVPLLVVDDNATNRRILQDSVTGWKMMPTVVEGAAAALQALQHAHASGAPLPLVLTDAHMPEIDGFGLVERIRQDPSFDDIKIVVLTSGGERGDAARCQRLGVAAYLSKPFDRLDLREVLLRVLAGDPVTPEKPNLVTRHTLRESQHSLSFLVAEDNAVNQRLIARLQEKKGHTVTLAQNGREALDVLEKRSFDIVLMDGQMPEMDGFEATRRIREKEKTTGAHLPIIALTAHAMQGDKERCLAAGMDAYVPKPLKLEDLFSVIENLAPGITRR